MTTVVVDTSTLRQEGLRSAPMQLLTQLAAARHVRIVVPDVVAREFLSQRTAEARDTVEKATRELQKLARKLNPTTDLHRTVSDLAAACEPLKVDAVAAADTEFAHWMDTTHAERIHFFPDAIHGVIDDYFSGSGAFRAVKSREDFPDAFILSTIQTIAAQALSVYVVSGDDHLRQAAGRQGVAGVARSLSELLELPHFKQLHEQLHAAAQRRPELFSQMPFLDTLSIWLRAATDMLEDVYVEKDRIVGLEMLDVAVLWASVGYPAAQTIGTVIVDLAVSGEDQDYVLGVQFDAVCKVDFATTLQACFDLLEDDRRALTQESQDDEVMELSEWWRASFQGTLTLKLPVGAEINLEALSIQDLSPTLEVESAILIRPEHKNGK